MIRRMIDKDAATVAEMISATIQLADQRAKEANGPDALAFPPTVSRAWQESDVLPLLGFEAWVYEEGGVIMSAVIAHLTERDGQTYFRPIIGAVRVDAIKQEEHEAYLYKPLQSAVPDAIAKGAVGALVQYTPGHVRLDESLKGFSTADDTTIKDEGSVREFVTPFRIDEIIAKSSVIDVKIEPSDPSVGDKKKK